MNRSPERSAPDRSRRRRGVEPVALPEPVALQRTMAVAEVDEVRR
jgi:hypothetical protein